MLDFLTPSRRTQHLAQLTPDEIRAVNSGWHHWRRPDQTPPDGDWSLWLFMGGRGAGKTKAGAEWVNAMVASGGARRIGLIGETMHDARSVMVEGQSGLLNPHDAGMRPRFEPSKRRLSWVNGAEAFLFSAEDPEQLRGPEFDLVWADEFAKWRHPEAVFDMVQFGLRLGTRPRMMVTTTPRNIPALKRMLVDPKVVVTTARTQDNARHLPARFIERVTQFYGGSRLGRQELSAEILEDDERALWKRGWIDAARVRVVPELVRVVVAVDPPVTAGRRSDACGIVVAGRAGDGALYVLADRTVQGMSPQGWALRAGAAVSAYGAQAVVVETNQGGDLVTALMKEAAPGVRVMPVRATLSKRERAVPVSVLYEQGRVHHVGSLAALEDEMCLFGVEGGHSPDRVDALVWALSDLAPGRERVGPRVRVV